MSRALLHEATWVTFQRLRSYLPRYPNYTIVDLCMRKRLDDPVVTSRLSSLSLIKAYSIHTEPRALPSALRIILSPP